VYWEQTGIQVTHKLNITRPPETTAPAVKKHIVELLSRYPKIHVVNLLKQNDTSSQECILGDMFRTHVHQLCRDESRFGDNVKFTNFDFHATVKRDSYEKLYLLTDGIKVAIEDYGFFLMDDSGRVLSSQSGVFRTNCLDCLDRTNVGQT
jgi:hypothetical protein